jgi:hypothetical protein
MAEKMVSIKVQVIEDFTTGLRLEFRRSDDGEARLRLSGPSLPFGNREILFDRDGEYAGAGTLV